MRTFLLMGLIRSLDCYRNVSTTFSQWGSMVTHFNAGELFSGGLTSFGLTYFDYGVILLSAAVAFFVSRAGKETPVRHRVAARPILWCLFVCLLFVTVLVFGAYGIGYDASQFIYSQF